jgi:hypothetical protein
MDKNDFENRLSKIEEHIKCFEKNKDQKWKEDINKKLDNIINDIKSEIKALINQSDKEHSKRAMVSDGRTLLAAGLPILAIGFAQWLNGIINIENYKIINAAEFYTWVIGLIVVILGFRIINRNQEK